MIRIIDNKKIELTEHEYELYLKIVSSYDNGKDLFRDLFETDDDGIIVFLRPPSRFFSMDVVLYVQNIMIHQHLRRIDKEASEAVNDVRKIINEARDLLIELKRAQ
jgi:hypothetical protein